MATAVFLPATGGEGAAGAGGVKSPGYLSKASAPAGQVAGNLEIDCGI